MNEPTWLRATLSQDDGMKSFARFDSAKGHVLADDAFKQAIWFEIVGMETTEIDEFLADLDGIEDAIMAEMATCLGCEYLVAITGAGYRDMIFAYGGSELGFDAHIRALIEQIPGRFNVTIKERDFGPYAHLMENVP